MKLFLDTNTILDVLCKREPYYVEAARIWTLIKEKILEGFISAISVNNLYYIVRKIKDQNTAEALVYEDSIQYFSAINAGCEVLITRNKKDFPANGINIFSPQEFIKTIWS